MTNAEIAQVFTKIAQILEIQGENPFRIRAYERAAQTVGALSQELASLYHEGGVKALEEIPGIGKDLALKIEELLKTGKLSFLNKLEKQVPAGLLEIMAIEGMGPKHTKLVWGEFGVHTVAQLRRLLKSRRLTQHKGWGEKSVANILRGLELQQQFAARLPIGMAWPIALEIIETLKRSGAVINIEPAGSLRRMKETVGDIDILVTSNDPKRVMDVFCAMPQVQHVLTKGPTKSMALLKAGIQTDVRVLEPDVFGAALHYFTGSKEHNVQIRTRAVKRHVTISEYGVFRGTAERKGKLIAARTEADVFKTVGLPYIPPELREGRGEIEAALKRRLPKLLEVADIKGDLHVHSYFSDGGSIMEEMVLAAKRAGLEYIAITDHASVMGMVRGIKEHNIATYLKKIEAARKKVRGIQILAGAEVDILEDGRLYLPDAILKKLDWIVASVHQNFKMPAAQMTKRIVKAASHPAVCALGHPTTRLLGRRPPVSFDMEAVIMAAKKHGVALELNASIYRLDLSDIHCQRAKELGTSIVINSDAHAPQEVDVRFGVAQARRGWLEKNDVINALPWPKFQSWLQKKRSHGD